MPRYLVVKYIWELLTQKYSIAMGPIMIFMIDLHLRLLGFNKNQYAS